MITSILKLNINVIYLMNTAISFAVINSFLSLSIRVNAEYGSNSFNEERYYLCFSISSSSSATVSKSSPSLDLDILDNSSK